MKKNRREIALVTGASSGMGRSFVRQIAGRYPRLHEIWVTARREEELLKLQREVPGMKLRILPLDLSDCDSFTFLQEILDKEAPCIRILVNSAGVGYSGLTQDQDPKELCRMTDVNCRALICLTRICLPYLVPGSRIVQLASGAAFAPQPGFAAYAASKACVLSFSRALREELRPAGIRVTAVCPGPVRTSFFQNGGIRISPVKRLFLADPERVVNQALLDAAKGKSVSVYGLSMKFVRLLSQIFPQEILAWLAGRFF